MRTIGMWNLGNFILKQPKFFHWLPGMNTGTNMWYYLSFAENEVSNFDGGIKEDFKISHIHCIHWRYIKPPSHPMQSTSQQFSSLNFINIITLLRGRWLWPTHWKSLNHLSVTTGNELRLVRRHNCMVIVFNITAICENKNFSGFLE